MTYLARIDEITGTQHHRTLIDVRRRAEEALMGLQRRDTLSALDCLAKVLGLRLDAVPATASRIRDLLGSRTAAELGLSEKRYANICAAVRSAVRNTATRSSPDHPRRYESIAARRPLENHLG